jgi:imidazole glycerol-phosphate synthase subunit HisH
LGWIKAKTIRFNHSDCTDKRYRIPHIGWNSLQINKENKLLEGITEESFFYFVHSYHVVCENENDILTNTKYAYSFTSVVHHDNIWGTQFHPEKSHQDGLRILTNFVNI